MEFTKYKSFHDEKIANELIAILKENQIEYEVADLTSSLDSLYRGSNPIDREIVVKIKKEDFEKANKIWDNDLQIDLNAIDKNHYLFEFTNEELFDILIRPDEWSPPDHKLSIELLKKRGKQVDDDLIASLKKQRLSDLSKEESSQVPWIIVGYFASILGGIIGIGVGLHLMTSKKVLPNGDKKFTYLKSDRKQGKIIFILGIIFLAFWIAVRTVLDFL